MGHLVISVTGAVLPAILLVVYFYKRDAIPEPRRVLLWTFLLGILIVFPVVLVELPLLLFSQAIPNYMLSAACMAFIGAALPEECFKFLVLTRYAARHPAFDEPMDGVVYGATASLGFAMFENVVYVLQGGIGLAIFRAFTAVPAHAFFGVIAGYYVGQARFNSRAGHSIWRGLAVATLLHGLYDFGLMALMQRELAYKLDESDPTLTDIMVILPLGAIPLVVLIGSGIWSAVIVSRLRRAQLACFVTAEVVTPDNQGITFL